MTLTLDTATSAIFAMLKTKWDAATPAITGGAIPQTVYESFEQDLKPHPRDGTLPWARVVIRHADSRKMTLVATAGARYQRIGCAWVQVFVPGIDATMATMTQKLAMVAQSAFEGKRTPGDGVVFTKVTIKESPKDGPFFLANVVAYFTWEETR